MSEYKSLFLNQNLFQQEMRNFEVSNACEISDPIEKPKFVEYSITKTGQNVGLLQVFHLNNGCITLHYKVGSNIELSQALAKHLAEKF